MAKDTARLKTYKRVQGEEVEDDAPVVKRKKIDAYEIERGKLYEGDEGLVDWAIRVSKDSEITKNEAMKVVGLGQTIETNLVNNRNIHPDVLVVLMESQRMGTKSLALQKFSQSGDDKKIPREMWFRLYDSVSEGVGYEEHGILRNLFSQKFVDDYSDSFICDVMNDYMSNNQEAIGRLDSRGNSEFQGTVQTMMNVAPDKCACDIAKTAVGNSSNSNLHNVALRKVMEDEDCYCDIVKMPAVNAASLRTESLKLDSKCGCDLAKKMVEKRNFAFVMRNEIPEECAGEIIDGMMADKDYNIRSIIAKSPNLPDDRKCEIFTQLSKDRTKTVREAVARSNNIPTECFQEVAENIIKKDGNEFVDNLVNNLPNLDKKHRCELSKFMVQHGASVSRVMQNMGEEIDDCKCELILENVDKHSMRDLWNRGTARQIPEKCEKQVFDKIMTDVESFSRNGVNVYDRLITEEVMVDGNTRYSYAKGIDYGVIDQLMDAELETRRNTHAMISKVRQLSELIPENRKDEFFEKAEKAAENYWSGKRELERIDAYNKWKNSKRSE